MWEEMEDSVKSFVIGRFFVVCEESLEHAIGKFDRGDCWVVCTDFQTCFTNIVRSVHWETVSIRGMLRATGGYSLISIHIIVPGY